MITSSGYRLYYINIYDVKAYDCKYFSYNYSFYLLKLGVKTSRVVRIRLPSFLVNHMDFTQGYLPQPEPFMWNHQSSADSNVCHHLQGYWLLEADFLLQMRNCLRS